MICYMEKNSKGTLQNRYLNRAYFDPPPGSNHTVVPVEVREYDEKRKLIEDAAEDLLAECKNALGFISENFGDMPLTDVMREVIAKAEGKE